MNPPWVLAKKSRHPRRCIFCCPKAPRCHEKQSEVFSFAKDSLAPLLQRPARPYLYIFPFFLDSARN
jgi:hypothetical protein